MLEFEASSCNLCRYPATRRLEEQGDWPQKATGITTWKGSVGQGGHQTCSSERGGRESRMKNRVDHKTEKGCAQSEPYQYAHEFISLLPEPAAIRRTTGKS